jgi:hypothetical protein
MTQRPEEGRSALSGPASMGDLPSPDIVAFIRFCHGRRHAHWPELYDEMCAVAARREFNGWGHAQLAERGLAFSLFDMPRLAGWVRATLAAPQEGRDPDIVAPAVIVAGRRRVEPVGA